MEKNSIPYQKCEVARIFNRAAETYAEASFLEKEMGTRLLQRLEFIKLAPARILDLGGGTGFFSEQLASQFSASTIYNLDFAEALLNKAHSSQNEISEIARIAADIEHLPLQSNSIDLVFSNSVIHWLDNVQFLFKEIYRILKADGLFLFSTLGPDTLYELRTSFSNIDSEPHVNRFTDMHLIGDALMGLGFSDPVMDKENLTFTYQTVSKLLRDLKSSGSSYVFREKKPTFTRKTLFKEMSTAYQSFQLENGQFPAAIEIIYGHAVKPVKLDAQLYQIPISQIQRSRA